MLCHRHSKPVLDGFTVKGKCIPARDAPRRGTQSVYTVDQLSKKELVKKHGKAILQKRVLVSRHVKFFKEEPDVSSKKKREIYNNIVSLKPWDYLKASSESQRDPRERAVLQFVKPQLSLIAEVRHTVNHRITDEGFSKRKLRPLYSMYHMVDKRLNFKVYDLLVLRYIHWSISKLLTKGKLLKILGVTPTDLAFCTKYGSTRVAAGNMWTAS